MARQKLGQHFLVRQSVLERIAATVCPRREPVVVEIGPGKGALTEHLLRRADRVVAIEIDERLAALLAPDSRLTIIADDALRVDLARWDGAAIAGNLPYYAATPILERVLRQCPRMERAVFLVQKEVAQRLAAAPGSRDYGYLSVATQLFARVERLFDVRPSAFRPPPKVDSCVVRLIPRAPDTGDPDGFLRFAGLCFRQKRKTIRNNLAGVCGKALVEGWPEASLRAEQLSLEQFTRLYERVVRRNPLPSFAAR